VQVDSAFRRSPLHEASIWAVSGLEGETTYLVFPDGPQFVPRRETANSCRYLYGSAGRSGDHNIEPRMAPARRAISAAPRPPPGR
jgi:hypothetical protein